MPITSTILIYNPNDFDVKISASNYGLTNRPNWQSDIIAWEDYFSISSPIEKTVPANGYDNIFSQSIPAVGNGGNVFGIVSRLSVTDLNGKPASVVLFDLAYAVDSSSATECAEAEDYSTTLRYRGLGKGFYETFNLPVLEINNAITMKGFKFGKERQINEPENYGDSFNGADLIQMKDASNQLSPTKLAGNYGVQMAINMSIKNTGNPGNFAIFYGSNGGIAYPFISYNGYFGKPTYSEQYGQILSPLYADILDLGWIEPSDEPINISFFTALTAMGAAPLVLGIRRL